MKIYQNKNGKWVIDFTYRNRRIRRVVGEKRNTAEAAMIRIKNDILTDKYGFARPKKVVLFEKFTKEYFELHSKEKRSWQRDRTSIKNLKSFFKGKLLSSITPDQIEKYKAKRKQKVSPASVNRELACLKNIFTKAIDWNKVNANPVKKVKLLKEDNKKEKILNEKEIESLIQASENSGSFVKEVIIIGLNTGMRKDEILSLKWEDIDFKNVYIKVKNSKSGKSRKIPMNILVIETLKKIENKNEFVFYNPKTKNYVKSVQRAFKTACGKAGIKGMRFHDLRHTAASNMIEAGIDLVTVSKILGHASIQMTMRYAHPTSENMQRAVDKLGEIFERSKDRIKEGVRTLDDMKQKSHLFLYN